MVFNGYRQITRINSFIIPQTPVSTDKLLLSMKQPKQTSIRIDKWLWAARFFKTRSLAQHAVELGRIHVEGQKIKPAKEVKRGDILRIKRGEETFEIEITAISSIRGAAPFAQQLYSETESSKIKRKQAAELRKLASEPAKTIVKGRPTKRDARHIRRVKASW